VRVCRPLKKEGEGRTLFSLFFPLLILFASLRVVVVGARGSMMLNFGWRTKGRQPPLFVIFFEEHNHFFCVSSL